MALSSIENIKNKSPNPKRGDKKSVETSPMSLNMNYYRTHFCILITDLADLIDFFISA